LPNRAPLDLIQKVFPNAETWMFYGSAEASFIGYAALGQPYKVFPEVELEIRDDKSIWVRSPMTVSPGAWVNTGDLGCWVESGRFEIIGRVSRQLQVKGKKYLTESVEDRLSTGLDLDRVALLQDRSGHVCCICARSGFAAEVPDPTLARVNQLIRECDPAFPLVRRIQTLAFGAWPLTGSGKTNWQALADHLDLAP
jgi:acyl-CoA synthetase (AMP-forming)/AMP-acid ligase II